MLPFILSNEPPKECAMTKPHKRLRRLRQALHVCTYLLRRASLTLCHR